MRYHRRVTRFLDFVNVSACAVVLFALGGCATSAPVVVRAPGAGPKPTLVAVIPMGGRNDDRQVDVWRGCSAGVHDSGVAFVGAADVAAALGGRRGEELDDRGAAELGKKLGAQAVVVGDFYVGHFSSGVSVRLVRSGDAGVDATAKVEDPAVDEAARRVCAAVLH